MAADAKPALVERILSLATRPTWDPLGDLFRQQREFVEDKARRKTALCTRQAGKTHSTKAMLHQQCLTVPNSFCIYIALTRLSAKRLMWRELIRDNHQHKLGIEFNHSELLATYPNGSRILVTGASDEADIETLRGPAYHLVVIDESASFPSYFGPLVDEVISPALAKHDGVLALVGTPGPILQGLFYEATAGTEKGWSRHHWSIYDNNVGIPNARAYVDAEKERRGWTEQTPAFLREYRGIWVRSGETMLWAYDPAASDYDTDDLPKNEHWSYCLGVDVGWHDHTALVLLGWHRNSPNLYAIESDSRPHMIPSATAEWIESYLKRYRISKIVMDTGGLGKAMAEEFKQRYHFDLEAADKRQKPGNIELANGDMRKGLIKIESGTPLARQMQTLQRDEKGMIEHPSQPSDLSDAFLYAWRFAQAYLFRPKPPPPTPAEEERAQIQREMADLDGRDNLDGPEWL